MTNQVALGDLLASDTAGGMEVMAGGVVGGSARVPDAAWLRCARALHESGASLDQPVCGFFVPGRIEVLGKHTDYAGGRSLLAAIERGFYLAVAGRADDRVILTDARAGQPIDFSLASDVQPGAHGWANYPMAVVRRVARNFPEALQGADIAFTSDLPPAAGMSSSSALVVATFLALSTVNRLPQTDAYRANLGSAEDLADYLSAVENGRPFHGLEGDRGVGTRGGSEDHTAILCARPGALTQYAFVPVRFERVVSMPVGYTFAIGCSGVRAEKTGSAREQYNRASRLMTVAAELWRDATGAHHSHVGAVLESGSDAAGRLREVLRSARHPEYSAHELRVRVDQFIAESHEIIPAAADALAAGALDAFGELVDRSQRLAERMLGNQTAETVYLARSARERGAAAASAFGGGFGGSVWALVEKERAARFLESWRSRYLDHFPDRSGDAEFFLTAPGPPARRLV
ncbi:MAG: galactokinase family protein [Longimicrobiales bacterium]